MATHVKIKTPENNYVHFDTHRNSYTLCGLETGGDGKIGIQTAKTVKAKVNCPDCLRILHFCKSINKNEY